ncbi:MAG: hypothetical protein AAGF15_10170 [Pseudomonadota bacterium]
MKTRRIHNIISRLAERDGRPYNFMDLMVEKGAARRVSVTPVHGVRFD